MFQERNQKNAPKISMEIVFMEVIITNLYFVQEGPIWRVYLWGKKNSEDSSIFRKEIKYLSQYYWAHTKTILCRRLVENQEKIRRKPEVN